MSGIRISGIFGLGGDILLKQYYQFREIVTSLLSGIFGLVGFFLGSQGVPANPKWTVLL